jgi:hypothetical protein
MKIWLDDIRLPPTGWFWCKTANEALECIKNGGVVEISFDHDLGDSIDAIEVAKFIEEGAYFGSIAPISWKVHSANPVGKKNISLAMSSADRFWNNQ